MCWDRKQFSDYCLPSDRVMVANSTYMPVIGKGTVYLRTRLSNGERTTLKLLNVLHTPDVPHNLVSLTRTLATRRFVQSANGTGAIIRRATDNVIIAEAKRHAGVLKFDQVRRLRSRNMGVTVASSTLTSPKHSDSESLALWHAQFGHLHERQ